MSNLVLSTREESLAILTLNKLENSNTHPDRDLRMNTRLAAKDFIIYKGETHA
jgi:hypothetical protein